MRRASKIDRTQPEIVAAVATESAEQRALFAWARLAARTKPELALLYAVPNGGARAKSTAGRLKAEGVRPGVPDVCLPVPRGNFGACYIELKRGQSVGTPRGRASPEQLWWLGELQAAGNFAAVAYGWTEARRMLEAYLSAPGRVIRSADEALAAVGATA